MTTSADEDAEALIRDADAAMSRAKRRAGAGWAPSDDQLRAGALARLDMERDLRVAIEDHQRGLIHRPSSSPPRRGPG